MAKNLLITVHMPSPNTRQLGDALLKGAQSQVDKNNLAIRFVEPLKATSDDVQWADGILLGTTENFGYMSGAMKDFFDRIYYPCLEIKQGLPCAVLIRAGLDGTGTKVALDKILTGLKWRQVQPTLISKGDFLTTFVDDWFEVGAGFAAGLDAGIF